jgi:hypothetical protein
MEEKTQKDWSDLVPGWDEMHWRDKFISALRITRGVNQSADAAGISRSRLYQARGADEIFCSAWTDAVEANIDDLEQSAMSRAIDGWHEPWKITEGGNLIFKKCFSTSLTIFLLKAWRPDRYLFEGDEMGFEERAEESRKMLKEALGRTEIAQAVESDQIPGPE